jgi:hypothetical protein
MAKTPEAADAFLTRLIAPATATFNRGSRLTGTLGAAVLDMRWHSMPAGSAGQPAGPFDAAVLEKAGLGPQRRRRGTDRATSCTSGRTGTRRAAPRTSGPRCSTATPARGSSITAG